VSTVSSGTYIETIQHYVDEYFSDTGKERATAKEIAVWLIQTGRWEAPSDLMVRQCRADVAKAMREEYIKDSSGRSVRVKHVARVKEDGERQQFFWADFRNPNTPHSHWEVSFQQRREQVVGECKQLKTDVDYCNSRFPSERQIEIVFDFTDDIAEAEFSGEYPPRNPR
jgi:hypothetical protein